MEKHDAILEELLTRGVETIYPSSDELRRVLSSGKKLAIYLGLDPTGPSLHIGHAVPLRTLGLFQKMGHRVILLIGDFTAMIGDPTGKSTARKPLTHEEVLANALEYKQQASQFLDFSGSNPAELKYNFEWLSKLSFADVIKLASHVTLGQMIERDMFQERMREGKPISLHEFMYPLMQGYDSVAMDVDVEIGGNDQTFNMLMGRSLAKKFSDKEKFVLANKLLTDSTGKKMGKSEGNMVTLADSPREMFGKIMSWSDGLILPGFELCTDISNAALLDIEQELKAGVNPRDVKMRLAREVVGFYHGKTTAAAEEAYFVSAVSNKEIPTDIPVLRVAKGTPLKDLLVGEYVRSGTEYRQKITEGAIDVDGERVTDPFFVVNRNTTCRIGKHRFLKFEVIE